MLRGIVLGDLESSTAMEQSLPPLKKAVQIDDQLAQAHNILSFVYLFLGWDFKSAERERAIAAELNPEIDRPNVFVFLATGRFKEALDLSKMVAKTHPRDNLSWEMLAQSYALNGQLDKAMEAKQQQEQLLISPYLFFTAKIRFYVGRYTEIIEIAESISDTFSEIAPLPTGYLALSYYHTGLGEKADLVLDQLQKRAAQSSAGSPSYSLAMIYAEMGEIDTAFEWLEKAYQDHEVEMYWLKVEPPFEPLRSDPRWQEMLEKVGFPDWLITPQ